MKYIKKIVIAAIFVLSAGTLSLNAQRGMRGMRPDSMRINRPSVDMMQRPDSLRRGMMARDMMPLNRENMYRGRIPMYYMPGSGRFGMRPGNYMWRQAPGIRNPRMYDYPPMRYWSPRMGILDNIPGLTDDQKKKMEELRKNNQADMQKFKEDMQNKIKEMRSSQRSKLRDLLNDEQKKWFDEHNPVPLQPQSPQR
jgi:hypothetical protein